MPPGLALILGAACGIGATVLIGWLIYGERGQGGGPMRTKFLDRQ